MADACEGIQQGHASVTRPFSCSPTRGRPTDRSLCPLLIAGVWSTLPGLWLQKASDISSCVVASVGCLIEGHGNKSSLLGECACLTTHGHTELCADSCCMVFPHV